MYFLITAISHTSSLDTVFGFILILSGVDAQEFLCSRHTLTALLFTLYHWTSGMGSHCRWVPMWGTFFFLLSLLSLTCNMKSSVVTTPQTVSIFCELAIHNTPHCPCMSFLVKTWNKIQCRLVTSLYCSCRDTASYFTGYGCWWRMQMFPKYWDKLKTQLLWELDSAITCCSRTVQTSVLGCKLPQNILLFYFKEKEIHIWGRKDFVFLLPACSD